jgi:type IV pilus assembly protein PilW
MTKTRLPPARPEHRARGFTLVELMVAMTIGLVLALAISLSMLSMGRQFRIVGANSAAQVNSQLALSLIDGAGRAAGAGLFNNGQPLCQSFNAWYSGSVKSNGTALMPARIVDGGSAGASDQIVFSSSTAVGPLSGMAVLDAMATSDASIVVSDAGLVSASDVAIVGVPGSTTVPCTLFQVSAAPTVGTACGGNAVQCKTLQRTAGGSFNAPAGTFSTEPRYGFATAGAVSGPAAVMRLGAEFRQDGFQVLCNTLVSYNAFTDNPSCTAAPLAFAGGANALVSDVVLMHAQYGISASASSDVVTNWVDASGGTWGAPSAANIGRIKAIRVVVVTRSKEFASELVTAASCTNAGGVVNTGPCSFDDAEAPSIDLSGVAVPSGRSWRNYRYRVHQAVIPLRNVIWSS